MVIKGSALRRRASRHPALAGVGAATAVLAMSVLGMASQSGTADTLQAPPQHAPAATVATAAPTMPVRGMDMRNVEHIFGSPLVKLPPVGNPPISRWIYGTYVVYFEKNMVLESVTRTDSSGVPATPPATVDKRPPVPAPAGMTPPAPAPAAPAATPAGTTAPGPNELLLDVYVNEQEQHETALFLQLSSGELLAQPADLQNWRLIVPNVSVMRYDNTDFYPLKAIPGSRFQIDTATQTIHITVPASALASSVIDGFYAGGAPPQPSPPGGFLNYSLFASHTLGSTVTNGFMELGLFNSLGVVTDTELGNDLNGPGRQWIRLETTFTHDRPDAIASLRIGDAITSGGMTGLDVRFGGIQYGTNFATQPGLATLPLPSIGGSAAVPSTVQLYVNGVLQRTQQVQPGPFLVPTVPVSTGPGVITLVVRDLLGRQQVITEPFYAANTLLAKGLDDYSYSFGKERLNFGVESDDYGPALASAVFRRGYTDSFTGEVRGEAAPGQQTAGLGGFFSAGTAGVFNLAVAGSHSTSLGDGGLGQVGYQYLGSVFNAGMNVQVASPHFTQAGYLPGTSAPHLQASADVGAFLGSAGSASLGYIREDDPVLGKIRLMTFNYTKTLGASAFLSFNVYRDLSGQGNSGELLSITLPLGEQRSASFGVSHQSGNTAPFAEIQRSLPAGTGYGYRLATQFGPQGSSQGELDYQNDVGTYDVSALHSAGQTLYQGGLSGGLGYIGGDFFASRTIDSSFAVVEVPGQANVDVYAQNQVVGQTDSHGYAVIPRLNPYQENHIGYDPRNLPLDTDIAAANMTLVPYFRSGLLARFDVKTLHGVTFVLKLPDGQPVPAGAVITVPGQATPFPVGYDGEAYVTGLPAKARLQASWADQTCEFTVEVPSDNKDPLPDLGMFTCEAVKP